MDRKISEPSGQLDRLASAVINCALEVHSVLGPGFLEGVYEEALAVELSLHRVPFERQKVVPVSYKGRTLGEGRLDFLVDRQLVVELKAVDSLVAIHKAQVLSYLKATNLQLGLLLNFNTFLLGKGIKRVIRSG
jgi:GxxExxY protein